MAGYLSGDANQRSGVEERIGKPGDQVGGARPGGGETNAGSCLLYTSDAADERSSVDLGGRRIIKKKTTRNERVDKVTSDQTN